MRITQLSIDNFKSLRNVRLTLKDMSVFVGPNASGKSNFANAIEFLSNVYKHGLESAVALHGGFENIAYRKVRRTKQPIEFRVALEISTREMALSAIPSKTNNGGREDKFSIEHRFSIQAHGGGIRADFKVVDERIEITGSTDQQADMLGSHGYSIASFVRDKEGKIQYESLGDSNPMFNYLNNYNRMLRDYEDAQHVSAQDLMVVGHAVTNRIFRQFSRLLSQMAVYKISPEMSRKPGVPTPNPSLSTTGENLPAIVDWLKNKNPRLWSSVLNGMRDVLPELEDIEVQYLHTKAIGLQFKEIGVGRPWTAEEVSDGTIQALALLVVLVDPRNTLLLIEEPENSLHPWIIRNLIRRFYEQSKSKNILVTTHSLVVLDMLRPEQIYLVFKKSHCTNVVAAISLNESFEKDWEEGRYKISTFLDSGEISEVLPGGSA